MFVGFKIYDRHTRYHSFWVLLRGSFPLKWNVPFGSVAFSGRIRLCKVFGDNVPLQMPHK